MIQTRGTDSTCNHSKCFGVIDIGACGEDTEKAASPKKSILMALRKDELEVIHQVLVAEATECRSLDRAGPTRFSCL